MCIFLQAFGICEQSFPLDFKEVYVDILTQILDVAHCKWRSQSQNNSDVFGSFYARKTSICASTETLLIGKPLLNCYSENSTYLMCDLNYLRLQCVGVYTSKPYRQLPKVHMWRLKRDSNPRPTGRKASTLPMRHHAPCGCLYNVMWRPAWLPCC